MFGMFFKRLETLYKWKENLPPAFPSWEFIHQILDVGFGWIVGESTRA